MQDTLWNRIKQWWCVKVGHNPDPYSLWGNAITEIPTYAVCLRCRQHYKMK